MGNSIDKVAKKFCTSVKESGLKAGDIMFFKDKDGLVRP